MNAQTTKIIMETIQAAYPRLIINERTVEVWRLALDGCDDGEAGDAVLTLLRENPQRHQPTPADILRVIREQRRERAPEIEHDPRAVIPMQEAARVIVEDLAHRFRASGRPIPARRKK